MGNLRGFMLGLPEVPWEEIIPPQELRKIRALEREYERLAKKIDKVYATGRLANVEDLEERAMEIEEKLVALYEVYSEAPNVLYWQLDEMEPSLNEELAKAYLFPPQYWTPEEQVEALKNIIRSHLLRTGRDIHPTREEALEAAKDAADRWLAIRKAYRSGLTR